MTTVRVAIVGAGIAGLTAALRLLERGYQVTVYDRKSYVGGKLGAHTHPPEDFGHKPYIGGIAYRPNTYHEHCYHMFLNWYHNFWRLAKDIGLSRETHFKAQTSVKHLRQGDYPRMRAITNPGSLDSNWDNLRSGVRSLPDMFLYAFSIFDLLTHRFSDGGMLSQYTVNGFMQSRPYATEGSTSVHETTLAKAFACPSYLTSARSYQAFAKYSFRLPKPALWVLKGDCERHFNRPLRTKLDSLGCQWRIGHSVLDVDYDERAKKVRLESYQSLNPEWPHPTTSDHPLFARQPPQGGGWATPMVAAAPAAETAEYDYVILAVPPTTLRHYFQRNQEFAKWFVTPCESTIQKLHTEPIASLDLYLKTTLPGLPADHVVLDDSTYGLTFIDNSQLWPDVNGTYLNVVSSDFDALADLSEEMAMFCIVEELGKYLPVKYTDIEYWHIETNAGDQLFLNEVGSELWRPKAKTNIPILFLAGDYCQTVIDVVTVEGAVVSGLAAATALQGQVAADRAGQLRPDDPLLRPVEIIVPESYPEWVVFALKTLLTPYAVAAKYWSWMEEQAQSLSPGTTPVGLTPRGLADATTKLLWAPYQFGLEWWRSAWSIYTDLGRGRKDTSP